MEHLMIDEDIWATEERSGAGGRKRRKRRRRDGAALDSEISKVGKEAREGLKEARQDFKETRKSIGKGFKKLGKEARQEIKAARKAFRAQKEKIIYGHVLTPAERKAKRKSRKSRIRRFFGADWKRKARNHNGMKPMRHAYGRVLNRDTWGMKQRLRNIRKNDKAAWDRIVSIFEGYGGSREELSQALQGEQPAAQVIQVMEQQVSEQFSGSPMHDHLLASGRAGGKDFGDNVGVNAGEIHDYGSNGKLNPYGIEAGEIEGKIETKVNQYSSAAGESGDDARDAAAIIAAILPEMEKAGALDDMSEEQKAEIFAMATKAINANDSLSDEEKKTMLATLEDDDGDDAATTESKKILGIPQNLFWGGVIVLGAIAVIGAFQIINKKGAK